MHVYVRKVVYCHLYPVTCQPPSGVMRLHTLPLMLLKLRQSLVQLIKTCQVPKRSYYCGISFFLMQICLRYKLLCVIANGFMTPQLLLPFTLVHSFPALLELLRVMFEVLSAQHVFVLRRLLVLQRLSLSLSCQ